VVLFINTKCYHFKHQWKKYTSSVAVFICLFCDIISGEFFIYFPLPKYICVTYYKLSWAFFVLFISINYMEKHFIYNSLLIGSTIVLSNFEGLAAQLEAFICNFLLLCCYFLHSMESMDPSLFDKIWMCTVHFNHIRELWNIQFPLAQASWLTWPLSLLKWEVVSHRGQAVSGIEIVLCWKYSR